jgi:hypothetical protein
MNVSKLKSSAFFPIQKKLYGNSILRSSVDKFKRAAELGQYFVVLTDLDSENCPYELLQKWGVVPFPKKLLFRVAVRETEAWLLGDRHNFAQLLGIKPALIAPYPEQLADPKEALLELARKGHKKVQRELLPEKGAFGKTGPGYNDTLCAFVENNWDYQTASENAPSLQRLLNRIRQLNF